MMLIRPIARGDLDRLMNLARAAGVGLSSLPANEERLSARIERSVRSFAGELPFNDQGFVFVLEDTDTGMVAGLCGLESCLGMTDPWYNFRIGTTVQSSPEMGVYKSHEALYLSNDHTGYSELCSLFLHPDYRINRNGSLLSKCRFLFLAQFPEQFSEVVVAEMRGVSDDTGRSPFWEGLGRHFFSMDFDRAVYQAGVTRKTFIAELMPKYPIYIDLLPESARAVIREPHANTRPALAMLEAEGLRCENYVDIFDGGPTVQGYIKHIRAVRDSRYRTVKIVDAAVEGKPYLVSNTSKEGFRVLMLNAAEGEQLSLTAAQADTLHVSAGDQVRAVPVCPSAAS